MRYCIATALLALALGANVGYAQQTEAATPEQPPAKSSPESAKSSPELEAIRAGSKAFVDAFNAGDAKAIAKLWTDQAQYIDDVGDVYDGRDEIEQVYSQLFQENPNVKIEISIDSVRLVSNTVAIEDGRAKLVPPPAGQAGYSQYTAVHVKDAAHDSAQAPAQWRMASVRESWVEAQATPQSLADLQWLIGKWTSEEHGVKSESVYRWVADERFIERSYTTTALDGSQSSGVQLIGWNPLGGYMQSWSFSPDGGHAIGIWTPVSAGWSAEMIGMTGDGIPTRSVNLLAKLDDNGCVWQSTQRFAGDVALPDTDEVVLKRQSANP